LREDDADRGPAAFFKISSEAEFHTAVLSAFTSFRNRNSSSSRGLPCPGKGGNPAPDDSRVCCIHRCDTLSLIPKSLATWIIGFPVSPPGHRLGFEFLRVYPPFFVCFAHLFLSLLCITLLSLCLPVGVRSTFILDYLEGLENDSRRIEACYNIIKVCKRIAVELQEKKA
jgi:hypothetical protein